MDTQGQREKYDLQPNQLLGIIRKVLMKIQELCWIKMFFDWDGALLYCIN